MQLVSVVQFGAHIFILSLLHGFAASLLGLPCPFLSMTDQVRTFKGEHYVPVKVLRDPEQQWLSASWLLKQINYSNYKKWQGYHPQQWRSHQF